MQVYSLQLYLKKLLFKDCAYSSVTSILRNSSECLFRISTKSSILDVWLSSEYTSGSIFFVKLLYIRFRIYSLNHNFKHYIKYAKILVRENPYSRIFYAVKVWWICCDIYLSYSFKKSMFTNIYFLSLLQYCLADTENKQFPLKLFQYSSKTLLLKLF